MLQRPGGHMRWPRLLSSRKTIFFGLDITFSSIKLLELYRADDHYGVKSYGHCDLANDIMHGHFVRDIPALAKAIQQLLLDVGLYERPDVILEAVIAIPDACTISKTISVSDRLSDQDLEELVHLELEKFIPGSTADLCFDFKRLGSSSSHALQELLIVATRVQHVQDRLDALHHAGLRAKVVDIESFAIQRAFPFIMTSVSAQDVIMLLDVGHHVLKVYFFKHETLVFFREEELSHEPYLPDTATSSSDLFYGESLVLRIKRACHFFYAAHAQSAELTQILLSGDAVHDDLLQFISKSFKKPTYKVNPFTQMKRVDGVDITALLSSAAMYLTACGLAKRGC
ncbi:MAG: hypothetical protein CK424_08280 [Legionella sp.]|nr:MAG: hypothetical protein CK424_08280 [Legionella sp.]